MEHSNIVEFQVSSDYALFSDPITRVGGEKTTYHVPTYEALKGILSSVYWKPTIIWVIDKVRIMHQIQTVAKGIRTLKMNDGSSDLSYYSYLKDCLYQVQAHFEWNENRPELAQDRNENKHREMAKRMIRKGGRRDVFLGCRECQGYVESCRFGEGVGFYDNVPELDFGFMYHGITYPDEAYSENTKNKITVRFWKALMKKGVIDFTPPNDIPDKYCRALHKSEMKKFGESMGNFSMLEKDEVQ